MDIWEKILTEVRSQAKHQPNLMRSFVGPLYEEIFFQSSSLVAAISKLIATSLHIPSFLNVKELEDLLHKTLAKSKITEALQKDMEAFYERDPACHEYYSILLYYKGFYALCLYRVAHELLEQGEIGLAFYISHLCCREYTIDIHPRAQLASGIFIDHGNSLVIGETTVIDEDVSILQDVTLGGTGKESGDRHPKIKKGVLIGAGTKILGNVTIGAYSKIGAGSVVLKDIPSYATAVGVPAQVLKIDQGETAVPAREMDHHRPFINIEKSANSHEAAAEILPDSNTSSGLLISVDIGSNTLMMTIAESEAQEKNSNFTTWVYHDFIRFAQLAQGLREHHVINSEAQKRGEDILKEYRLIIEHAIRSEKLPDYFKKLIERQGNEKGLDLPSLSSLGAIKRSYRIKVAATSALREARNGMAVKLALEDALEAPIEIIDAKREAKLTFLGVTKEQNHDNSTAMTTAVLDIGGGSTEIGWGYAGEMQDFQGFSIGMISWKAMYPHEQLQQENKRIELKKNLEEIIDKENKLRPLSMNLKQKPSRLIGVAGVPTTLAAIHYGFKKDNFLEVDNKKLIYNDILELEQKLAAHTIVELVEDAGFWGVLNQGRASVMLFSTIVLRAFMDYYGFSDLAVSIRGLRYGLLEELKV